MTLIYCCVERHNPALQVDEHVALSQRENHRMWRPGKRGEVLSPRSDSSAQSRAIQGRSPRLRYGVRGSTTTEDSLARRKIPQHNVPRSTAEPRDS
jgi:hypothetical protein